MSQNDELNELRSRLGVNEPAGPPAPAGASPAAPPKPPEDDDSDGWEALSEVSTEVTSELNLDDGDLFELDSANEGGQLRATPTVVDHRPKPPSKDPATSRGSVSSGMFDAITPPPKAPPRDESQSVIVGEAPVESSLGASSAEIAPLRTDDQEREFFVDEACACADAQPERAALLWLEAATVAERAGAAPNEIFSHIDAALELVPQAPQVLPLLRRMLMRLGAYDRAFELLKREIRLGGDTASRVAVLLEAAAIVRLHHQDLPECLRLLQQVVALQPGHVVALWLTAATQQQLRTYEQLCDTLLALGEAVDSRQDRGVLLTRAATLFEHALDDPQRAEDAYRRASEADPENVWAVSATCRMSEQAGKWAQLAPALEHWSSLVGDPVVQSHLLTRAGIIYAQLCGANDDATRCFSAACQAAPQRLAPAQRLCETYADVDRPSELTAALQQLLALTRDPQSRAALLCDIGRIEHQRLNNLEASIAAYEAALEVVPGYETAVVALATLFRAQGQDTRLLAIERVEVETDPPKLRSARLIEIGQLLSRALGQPQEAIAAYQRALEIDPQIHLAYLEIDRLQRAQGQHAELVTTLLQQMDQSSDARTRHALALEIAELQAEVLGAADDAIATLRVGQKIPESRAPSRRLCRLLDRTDRHAELANLLLEEADSISAPSEAQGLQLYAARLMNDELNEPERALDVYQRVLAQDGGCLPAARGAARILHRLARWPELIELRRHELSVVEGSTAALLCEIATLHEQHLGDRAAATEAYEQALAAAITHRPALAGLERLLRAEQRWSELSLLLERYAASCEDNELRAAALTRAAEIVELQLEDFPRAADLCEHAARSGESTAALLGLLHVAHRQRSAEELVRCLETLKRSEGLTEEAAAQCGVIALLTAEAALSRPGDAVTLADLGETSGYGDRLWGEHDRLARSLANDELPERLEVLAEAVQSPALSRACLSESAQLFESRGDRAGMQRACERARTIDSSDLTVAWMLERALWHGQQWPALAQLLEGTADLDTDAVRRANQLHSAAIAALRGGKAQESERLAKACLAVERQHVPALRLLVHLAESTGQQRALATLCDELAVACSAPQNRVRSALRAAAIWSEELGSDSHALGSLQLALADDPTQPQAYAEAKRLLRRSGQFGALSQTMTRAIQATEDTALRSELLREHAALLHDELQQPARAISELNEALAVVPNNPQTLAELAGLHESLQRWADAATALMQLTEVTQGPERRAVQLRLADLLLQHLRDATRARKLLDEILENDPDNTSAQRLLADLLMREGKWEQAKELLEQVATSASSGETRFWATNALVEVAREGLRDEALCRRYESEALCRAASNPETLAQLVTHYRAQRRALQLVRLAEELLATSTDADLIQPLRVMCAEIRLELQDDPRKALEYLRDARVAQPQDQTIALLFTAALAAVGEHEAALAGYRRLLAEHIDCLAAYRGLAQIYVQLKRNEQAASVASILDLFGGAEVADQVIAQTLSHDALPAGTLPISAFTLPATLRGVASVMELAAPHLAALIAQPVEGQPLATDHPAQMAAERIAQALAIDKLKVLQGNGPTRAEPGSSITLQIDTRLVENARGPAFRFWTARALCGVLTPRLLFERMSDDELEQLLDALCIAKPPERDAQQLRKRVARALPRKLRKQLESQGRPVTSPQLWQAYRRAELERSNRLATVYCHSPGVALVELGGQQRLTFEQLQERPGLTDLLAYVVGDEFALNIRRLWAQASTNH